VSLPFSQTETLLCNLDQSLRLQKDLQDIVTKASLSLAENGLDLDTVGQQRGFDLILKSYVDKLSFVIGSNKVLSGMVTTSKARCFVINLWTQDFDKIFVAIAQLMLQSFQFFRPPDKHTCLDLFTLYTSACSLIAELDVQEKSAELVSHGTYYIFQGLDLAACCLLRLLKSPLLEFDTQDGQQLFFTSLNLLSKFSLANNDAPARASTSLRSLWRSDRVFKNEDGTWNLELRVRNRFCISVLYDCMWWSRVEFEGQEDPYLRRITTG
jgi:transcriptional regulatory protein LEU3